MPFSGFLASQGDKRSPSESLKSFPLQVLAEPFLPLERVRDLYQRAQQPAHRSFLENVLSQMGVELHLSENDLARVPQTGSVVVTANHPFGLLDGAILGALLARVRPDVKILTNYLLAEIPELQEHCIFVDPFGNRESATLNRQALRRCVFWLRTGGMLAIFPAGEVSHLDFRQMGIVDQEWNPMAAALIRLTGATALPVYFRGHNSVPFQAFGLLHASLRTAWLLNEFLSQEGKRVEVRIGTPISSGQLPRRKTDREVTDYLRWRTYLLSHRSRVSPRRQRNPLSLPLRKQAAIAPPGDRAQLAAEIAGLRPEQCLEENREIAIYLVKSHEVPRLMDELGRLRELTFRQVGEGTGKGRDLDRFDEYYQHLLLWSRTNNELIGAYRLGSTADILPASGISGLYTNALFRYDSRFFERTGPALELGRSFIREEYQRHFAPLLMLWKGIGKYLALHPEIAVVFGAVSISSRYHRVSRELIARFFESKNRDPQLAKMVRPRRPLQRDWMGRGEAATRLEMLDELAGPIRDLEEDGKGVPILIKQYAKLGGQLLSFNVDRSFSGVLDGFVLVDLRRTEPAMLARYMGKAESEAFRRYHGKIVASGQA